MSSQVQDVYEAMMAVVVDVESIAFNMKRSHPEFGELWRILDGTARQMREITYKTYEERSEKS